jgi:hypothetical protein
MQKMKTQLECKVGERLFHFMCDPDSPIEHVKESLFQFGKYVGAIEDAIKTQQEAQSKADLQPQGEPVTDEVKQEAA